MALFSVRVPSLLAALIIGLLAVAPALAQRDDLRDASELIKLGQYDRALTRVEAYLKERPKDARGRFLKGLILAEQKKIDDAIAVFTELTQDFPELPEPHNNLAVLYANQGQYEKARSALEMAIRTHPSYATAHENLGDVYAKMASQAYGKALQLDRGNRAAQTKLNLIRELFSSAAPAPKASATTGVPARTMASTATAAGANPAGEVASGPPAASAVPAPAPRATAAKPAVDPASPARVAATMAPRDDSQRVLQVVDRWARAWSANDVAAYLAHYAPDFEPPQGLSRTAWEAQRRARIAKPRDIKVTIEAPEVVFAGENRVKVTFRQRYRSDSFNASGTKTLEMVRQGEKWLIKREQFKG
jgi:ketosteroid isomerase-like protein/protein involved in temperature-dependent protein secretion